MKVKVIVGDDYNKVEKSFNEFVKDKEIVDVKVHEQYDIENDNGYIAYHVFYNEKNNE